MSIKDDLKEAKEEIQELKEQSLAMELYQDSAKDKRKFFYMWLITFIAFIGLLGYTFWLLNDIGTIKSVIGNDNHRLEDMYVVMNNLANDYQDIISLEDAETYIKMAHAWLDDVDQKEHKLWKYFVG